MTEKRPIDANELMARFFRKECLMRGHNAAASAAYKDAQKTVTAAPTVSLRPVAHWEESVCFDDAFWVCSNCKFPSEAIAAPRLYHYCPNCGAKMEAATNE